MKLIILVGLCASAKFTSAQPTWWDKHAASISCSAPGYFVNPADCRSFYRCVDRSTWNKPALQRYDFTCPNGMVFDPAVSVCTKPGSNGCADPWWGGSKPGSKPPASSGGIGAEIDFDSGSLGDSNGIDLDNLPPIFSSSRGPNKKPSSGASASAGGGAWFESSRPSNPSSGSGGNRPSSGGSFGGDFDFGTGGDDPLELDFGTPSDSNSGSLENNSGGSGSDSGSGGLGEEGVIKCLSAKCKKGDGSSSEANRRPAGSQNNGGNWREPAGLDLDSDSNPNSIEFDTWGSSNPGSRPSAGGSINWGGSAKPGNEHSPWRPTGPWGSGTWGQGQISLGESGTSNRPFNRTNSGESWWSPPYPAMPFRPGSIAPPPPSPWANPFRPRYPMYEIVAYPTWPGPYNRNPILVVYSNSKKK